MAQLTKEDMHPILEEYQKFKGTREEFCEKKEIPKHTLTYWQNKLKMPKGQRGRAGSNFIELEVGIAEREGSYELVYGNGNRLVLPYETPIELVKSLIKIIS